MGSEMCIRDRYRAVKAALDIVIATILISYLSHRSTGIGLMFLGRRAYYDKAASVKELCPNSISIGLRTVA